MNEQDLFIDHNLWLIYDQQRNISNFQHIFENKNLRIDTDLTYAYNYGTINEDFCYVTYDVYNKGVYLGGKLNMTRDKNIVCNITNCSIMEYYSSLHKMSKFKHRLNLSELTLRLSASVSIFLI